MVGGRSNMWCGVAGCEMLSTTQETEGGSGVVEAGVFVFGGGGCASGDVASSVGARRHTASCGKGKEEDRDRLIERFPLDMQGKLYRSVCTMASACEEVGCRTTQLEGL